MLQRLFLVVVFSFSLSDVLGATASSFFPLNPGEKPLNLMEFGDHRP